LFLAVIVQMVHDQRDMLKDYWLTQEQFYMVFYRNAMKWGRFLMYLDLCAWVTIWWTCLQRWKLWPDVENENCIDKLTSSLC